MDRSFIEKGGTESSRSDESRSHFNIGAAPHDRVPRRVFVAYPYGLFPREDYRRVFEEVGSTFKVDFVFADEQITNVHILQKIGQCILSSQFGIYDISGWNPNVTLELGLAFGLHERAYLALNTSKPHIADSPADLRGIDRIQYSSYHDLKAGLSTVLSSELPPPRVSSRPTVERIQQLVADHFKLRVSDLKKRNNHPSIVLARKVAMYLCKQQTTLSLPEIGQRFGGKHHSTVMYSIRRVDWLQEGDAEFRTLIHDLQKLLP